MINTYANGLLMAWGRWVKRARDGGTGWPAVSSMFREYSGERMYMSREPLGVGQSTVECEMIDEAIRDYLPEQDRAFLLQVYVVGGKVKDIAERIGCARETVSRRLERVQKSFLTAVEELELRKAA